MDAFQGIIVSPFKKESLTMVSFRNQFSSCNGILVTVGMLLLNISPNNLLKYNKTCIVSINPLNRMSHGT